MLNIGPKLFCLAVFICSSWAYLAVIGQPPKITTAVTTVSSTMSVSATVVRTCTTSVGVDDVGMMILSVACSDGTTTIVDVTNYSPDNDVLVIFYE